MHKPNQSIRNRLLVARLPAMPQILIKLIELCQKDGAGMAQLAKLIAHDAGISTKILSIANSSAYNRNSLKLDLAQSLNTLGMEMIKTLVINESVFQTFSIFSRANGADLRGFWVHALKAAVIARELAKKMSYPHSEEAYLAGLLHDVGRLALLSAAPHEYASSFIAVDDEHLCSTEESLLGLCHTEAGAWLIEQWNLDSFLADSVRYHHEPIARLKSAHPLIRLVSLAHLLSSYTHESPELTEAATLCGIGDMDLEALVTAANAHIKTAATYFGIDLSDADQALPLAQYEPPEPVKNRAEQKLADEVRNMALVSAAGQSFSSIHGVPDLLGSIARTARVLFNFEETVILLRNADRGVLLGFPIEEHQQRLSELSIPLADSGTIAESISKKRIIFAERNNSTLGIVDEQLLRAMGTECLTYIPLIAGQSCLGVLVGGLSSLQYEELWSQERFLKSFAVQAATSLQSSTAARHEIEKYISNANEAHREASLRVIHEVNNPLSIIKNYLGVLDDKLTNQQQVTEELSIINSEIDRVSRIVGELAQPQSTPQQMEITELNGVLKDVVRLFSISRFLPGSVNIFVRASGQAAEVVGSADPIKQILLNLIKNAVEALPMGGEIEVRNNGLKLWEGHAYIELSVSDTGAGIPADILANLFSPVRSSKNGERRGLGLNIVQSLIKKINGYISCKSGDSGTIFEVLLPAYDPGKYAGIESKRIVNMK